jgi:hypothetical protein
MPILFMGVLALLGFIVIGVMCVLAAKMEARAVAKSSERVHEEPAQPLAKASGQ